MLSRNPRTLRAGIIFVAFVPFATFVTARSAEARHHHHHRRYYGAPYVHLAYAPGYSPAVAFGYGYYPFSVGVAFPGGPKDERGTLRTLVEPRPTEVFIDGYYAGVVDDFDGSFQKLRLEPGPHTITLFLEGHRLYEETVYSSVGSEVKIRHIMEPLEPGEPEPARPGSSAPVPPTPTYAAPASPRAPSTSGSTGSMGTSTLDYGVLSVRPEPADARVWIEGEPWYVPEDTDRFTLHLPPGTYELKLEKDGFQSFVTDVEIFPGETTAMNVRLVASYPP